VEQERESDKVRGERRKRWRKTRINQMWWRGGREGGRERGGTTGEKSAELPCMYQSVMEEKKADGGKERKQARKRNEKGKKYTKLKKSAHVCFLVMYVAMLLFLFVSI